MKSKKSLYILIPLVVLVWSLVFYRLFAPDTIDVPYQAVKQNKTISAEEGFELDSFKLHADYTEPFLIDESTYLSQSRLLRGQDQGKETVQEQVVKVSWPNISYLGTIGNKKKRKQLTILNINGKEHFLKRGQVIDDIKLLKNYGDSIKLAYKVKEERVFQKKE